MQYTCAYTADTTVMADRFGPDRTGENARQAIANVTGVFAILARWSATTGAPSPACAGGRAI